jgi:hypothetical protein
VVLDLPEGQRESYPATSAGYCLRQSSERSERAAIKKIRSKIDHLFGWSRKFVAKCDHQEEPILPLVKVGQITGVAAFG